MMIYIFTDGSCLGNPGPGGWAFLVRYGDKEVRLQGGEPYTTNNRMELYAVIAAIQYVQKKKLEGKIQIFSDSSWVVKTMTDNWKRKKNLDLWEKLMPMLIGKNVKWNWVKGHAGHEENEDCDVRAYTQAERFKRIARTMDSKDLKLPNVLPGLF